MTAAANSWGPFAPDLDDAERRARLRCLRGLARVLSGPRAAEFCRHLAAAEYDASALPLALAALDRLPSVDRRQIVGTYGAVHRPAA
ncbi:hypothetical protein [Methylobacterium nonmethylotrophicum]|uniref:Uncharacterized protein n=1 Tax=Methylobacterium nonmethylotrophicum TaxID=1141884 RepID=A0A4Z0NFK2_9HYPH|nr:hypothetical protein [Methylobacterium nonmethylotrophicum]TGD93733.1 hypothetical protein EU555_33140 [Methylobacterium nonmethylotrophicum]